MSVLLIRPKFEAKHSAWISLPLGLAYIAAILEKENIRVSILDLSVENLDDDEIVTLIQKLQPKVIGIGPITTPLYKNALKTATLIKKKIYIPIIIGGPHPTALARDCLLEEKAIDIVVHGEGEYTFLELYKAICNQEKLADVKGISFREGEEIITSGCRMPILNLDEIPFPARHLLPVDKYFQLHGSREMFSKHSRNISIITSRGCPMRCDFCSRFFGQKWRARSALNVVDEIEQLVSTYKVKEYNIEDENFTFDKKRVMDICDEIIFRKLDIKIKFPNGLSVLKIDAELLEKMKKAGCYYAGFGIETGSTKVLKTINKGITLERVESTLKLAKKAGFIVHGFFMIGHLEETEDDFLDTIKYAKRLPLDLTGLSVLTPFPGTQLWETLKKENRLLNIRWDDFFLHDTLVFKHKYFNGKKILEMKKIFYRKFYLRPIYIFFILPKLIFKIRFNPKDIIFYAKRFFKLIFKGKLT